jgi:hypothetical protein
VHQRPHREDGRQKHHHSALVVHLSAALLSLYYRMVNRQSS